MTDHVPRARTLAEAFDPRRNSIGFLRWAMAFLVIFSHAGPLAGFYDGRDLGAGISREQSLGGVAVGGFFFFSGYLITTSRMRSSSTLRYLWRRAMRIFPAFWAALLVTAFVFAPIAWHHIHGSWDGFWDASRQSPWTYFPNNMLLELNQRNIAGMGDEVPLGYLRGAHDWNGSAWTLRYEFLAYLIVGVAGLLGVLKYRRLAGGLAIAILVLNAIQWTGLGKVSRFVAAFSDPYVLMFLAPFAFGALFALFAKRIPIDDRLAIAGLLLGVFAYTNGGWNAFGQFGFLYFLMWLAVRLPLQNWEKYGDFSYGIYIFAWPLMQFSAYFGLHEHGWFVYHLVIVVAVHIIAFGSYHLIEKPAMDLKNWTPRPLQFLIDRTEPWRQRWRDRLIDPRFSSLPAPGERDS